VDQFFGVGSIGRSHKCDIVLDEPYISRQHARLCFENDTYFIEDLKSEMGVTVNVKEISDKRALKNGDEIVLGPITITFLDPPSEEESEQFSEISTIFSGNMEPTIALSTPRKYKLIILSDKIKSSEHMITAKGLVIGRLKKNDVRLSDKSVSRQHARIWCEKGKVYLEDLGSRNGTFVDGKKITKKLVRESQGIRICSCRLFVTEASKEFIPPDLSAQEK